ncbi:Ig-like domain-containing protein [Paenibacillus terrigena]|uniref:Ig-like domain-containing protein n=1 Tax=Paenibacillus terrigena TaxID=369333 RepID=UPI0003752865|nr:Ig-like domain-containing protein [Paenibacillus terrigena]
MKQLKVLLCMILMLGMVSWAQPVAAAAADPTLVNLVLSDTKLSLETGSSKAIKSTAVYSDGNSKDVTLATTWSSGDNTIATITNGVIKAVKEGTVVIEGKFGAGATTQTSSLTVEVTKKVTTLSVNQQKVDLRTNGEITLQLTAYYEGGATNPNAANTAEWTSANNKVATVANGKITGHDSGTTTVTAKFGNQSVTIDVTVELVQRLDTLTPEVNMLVNEKKAIVLNATYPDGGTPIDVATKAEWTSSNEKVADVINGILNAYTPGKAVITAKYGSKTTQIQVDVDKTSKLELSVQNLFLKVNDVYDVTLKATYAQAAGAAPTSVPVTDKATWSSSDESIVYAYKGKLTALKTGTATIKAKYGDKEASLTVDVEVPRRLEVLSNNVVIDDSIAMDKNSSINVKLQSVFADGTTGDLTTKATWTSSNENIAIVSMDGGSAKITSYGQGESKITATYSGKSISFTVNIDVPRKLKIVEEITNQEEIKSFSLDPKGTKQLMVIALKGNSNTGTELKDKAAVWSSSDEKVAEVAYDAVTGKATITALDKGSATITVKYGTKSTSVKVDVAKSDKLEANKKLIYMMIDETAEVKLTSWDPSGKDSIVLPDKAEWSSSSEKIATVSNGTITALSSGKATITAKYGGKSVSIPVEVEVVQKIELSKKFLSMKSKSDDPNAPASVDVTLIVTFSDGKTKKDVTKEAEWKTSNYRVVDVVDGKVTPVGYGKAKVTAKYGTKSLSLDVEVDQLKYLKTDVVNLSLKVSDKSSNVKATAYYADGSSLDVSAAGLWKSSNIKVADIIDGIITVNGKGKTTLTVTYGGKNTKVYLVVQ